MDTHVDLRTPNPFEDARMTRRDALLGIGAFAALVGVANLVDATRSHITKMTPTQREYLGEVLAQKASWTDLSDTLDGGAKWMAKHTDGASITLSVRQTAKGEVRTIQVSDSPTPFTYTCPEWRHWKHDQPVVDRLLASARTTNR